MSEDTAQTLNANNSKVSLNMSDINEFPLLECTNEIFYNSPSSPAKPHKSSSNPLIIRKEQTLLSSTSSFFHDPVNRENNELMHTATAIYTADTPINRLLIDSASRSSSNSNGDRDMISCRVKQTTPAGVSFINAEFSGYKESTPCLEADGAECPMADCSEVVMEESVKTILPQLMDRLLKEVNYSMDEDCSSQVTAGGN